MFELSAHRVLLLCGGLLAAATTAGACQSPPDGLASHAAEPVPDAAPLPPPERPAEPPEPQTPPPPAEIPFGQNDASMLEGLEGEGPLRLTLQTSAGEVHCTLFEDTAPNAVTNFVGLATGRKAFVDPTTGERVKRPLYDGMAIHRVVPDYLFQFGDPTGAGTWNPGYRFADEHAPGRKADKPGLLAMANHGPDTNGAQVFVMAVADPHLEGRNTLLGQCDEADLPTIRRITVAPAGPFQRPLEPITIEKVSFARGEAAAGSGAQKR